MGDVAGHEFHGNQFGAGGGSEKSAKEHDAKSLADRAAARFHGDMEKSHKAAAKAATTPQEKDAHKAAAAVHGMAATAAKEGTHSPEHAAAAKALTDIANKSNLPLSVRPGKEGDEYRAAQTYKQHSDEGKSHTEAAHEAKKELTNHSEGEKIAITNKLRRDYKEPASKSGESARANEASEFAANASKRADASGTKADHEAAAREHTAAGRAHDRALNVSKPGSPEESHHTQQAEKHEEIAERHWAAAAKASPSGSGSGDIRGRDAKDTAAARPSETSSGFKTGVGAGHDASKGKISDEAKSAQASTRHPAGLAAREASNKAERQSAQATGPFTHGMASAMHENAAKANRTAGNHMAAAEHDAMAKHHAEAAGGTKYDAATKTFGQ